MIIPKKLIQVLKKNQINFITGVPDSVFKSVCFAFERQISKNEHISAANEGAAIGLAIGYYLATKKIPLVYFQNSGIGNAINPLVSLVNKNVYKIPMLLFIGWRGEMKGNKHIKDEPQHFYQGKITIDQLNLLGIDHIKINNTSNINMTIKRAKNLALKKSQPVAILIRKNTFAETAPATFTKKASTIIDIGSQNGSKIAPGGLSKPVGARWRPKTHPRAAFRDPEKPKTEPRALQKRPETIFTIFLGPEW